MTVEKMEESVPLITTYPSATLQRPNNIHFRRFFTIAFGSSLIAILLFHFVDLFPIREKWLFQKSLVGREELQFILLETPKEEKAQEWSRYYTSGPHLAGANFSQALWTQELWQGFGIKADIVTYDTYINYPLGHRLALYKGQKDIGPWEIEYEASLSEDVLEEDSTTGLKDGIPTFHGYSANGNVTAQYVYVNYGTFEDYDDLIKANVSLEGKIAIARYGGVFRGLKVKRAQELGMVGVVLFSDPGSDGAVTVKNGEVEYPKGPARQPSSVQRGSTQFLSFAPGDPTTPGYPSKPGVPRQSVGTAIPSIPSIPISYLDAIPLLSALNGHGLVPEKLNKWWQKDLGLKDKGIQYNIGPSPPELVLNLVNEQDYKITPIWNVIGIINGTLSDEVVILGNHRDAWIAGGAGDPNSGSAALNEVIRSFGIAISKGWKPLRTIVFASWDGEEYGLLGSTEWVEEYLPWLSKTSVAYVNVDIGTSGPSFTAAASPLLNNLLYEVTSLIHSPNQTIPGQTVADLWNGNIRTMGSGSDFTAFQDFAGIPSIDVGFKPDLSHVGDRSAVYHYHSNYDSFYWMNKFGDPGFHYHVTIAKILALLVAKLTESPVITLNATDYSIALRNYITITEAKLDAVISNNHSELEYEEARARPIAGDPHGSLCVLKVLFKKLHLTVNELEHIARKHDAWAAHLAQKANQGIPWWNWLGKLKLYFHIKRVNYKYKYLERAFLYPEGLDGRPWFKHVVFAPGLWTGYSGAVFPSLIEAIQMKNWTRAGRWAQIIVERLDSASKGLL